MRPFAVSGLVLALAAGCGGNVVFVDGDGGAGGASETTVSTTKATATTTVSTAQTSSSTVSTGTGPSGENLVELPQGTGLPGGTFTVQAEPGTLGLTFVARSPGPFSEIQITRHAAPSGATVIGSSVPSNGYQFLWYGTIAASTPQVSHPETFPLAQGPWSWDVQTDSNITATIWRRQTNDGAFHGGVLDVNVFIPDAFVGQEQVLENIGLAYGDWAGITVGDVRFFEVGGQYLSVDENNVFDYLGETAVVPTRPSLNLLLTASIEGQFSGAAGFSLGAPGAPTEPGSTMSGVVWMWTADPFFDPIILRHEAGHYGGLFHTSEFEAGLGDSLDDTPLCSDVLGIGPSCPDYDFIMFPTGGSGAGIFSDLQQRVLHGSALYRGSFAQGEPPMPPLFTQGGEDQAEIQAAPRLHPRAPSTSAAHAGAWRDRVVPEVAVHLAGIGCPNGSPLDYYETLGAAGGADLGAMIDIATDPGAPAYVRRRAIGMAARLAPSSLEVQALLGAIAEDENEPSMLRAGALRSLADVAPDRARATASMLAVDADPIVDQAVRTVGR